MIADNTIKRRPTRIDPAGEPIRASAWRNLHFLKSGRSFYGYTIFDTPQQARDLAESDWATERARGDELLLRGVRLFLEPVTAPGIKYFYQKYSHHIQVPVRP